MKALSSRQQFLHYKSMGKIFVTQGLVTLKWMVQSGPKSYLSEILWMSSLPKSMRKIQSKMKSLSIRQPFPHYNSIKFFVTQSQVTPKWIFQCGTISNFAEILCLSWLPARLIKIQSKLKALSIGQGQIWGSFGTQGQVTLSLMVCSG